MQYSGEQHASLIESDGLVFDDMEAVTQLLRANGFTGTPPLWMTAPILLPYLAETDDIRGAADFIKPATINQAKSNACVAIQKKNYYDYEKAMVKIAAMYASNEDEEAPPKKKKKKRDMPAQSPGKTWTQHSDATHIGAHQYLCETLQITLALAHKFLFNWYTHTREKKSYGVR